MLHCRRALSPDRWYVLTDTYTRKSEYAKAQDAVDRSMAKGFSYLNGAFLENVSPDTGIVMPSSVVACCEIFVAIASFLCGLTGFEFAIARQRIVYFGLEKEQKASALSPILKSWAHCFGGNSCDISDLQARRSCRSQSQNVDREIRTLWRAFTQGRIGQARTAQSVRYFKCRRSVQFLAPGSCYRLHQDRVFFAGLVVSHRRRVTFDTQHAAISARSVSSSANSTRPAGILLALRSLISLSHFAIPSIDPADMAAERIPAGMRA
jgi:hypothetical protein